MLSAGAGVAFILLYVGVALARIRYPFELEWMEGGMVDHVRRVLSGRPVYAEPSIEFVSFLYPPLYYDVASLAARVLGLSFVPLRVVSFVSSIGAFALLFAIVRRETGAVAPGLIAAGLFAATYDRVGGWFDLARLDSFYLLLLLAGIYVLQGAASSAAAALAGLLIGAAFFTKQAALVVAVPLAVAAALTDVKRAAWFTAAAAAVTGGGTMLADRLTGGWFRYYCFFLPGHHPRIEGGWSSFWTADLAPALPAALALAAYGVVIHVLPKGGRPRVFFPLMALGMVGSSWSVRNMVGAEVNNLLPSFAAVAVLAALAVHALDARLNASSPVARRVAALAGVAALVAQFALLAYDPRHHLPTPADRAAGEQLVKRLAALPGEVYAPHHGYLTRMAGKDGFAHTLAMDNVFLDDGGPARDALANGMLHALAEHRFSAVLLESDGRYGEAILARYDAKERAFASPDVFWPVTGGRLRPEMLCFPKP